MSNRIEPFSIGIISKHEQTKRPDFNATSLSTYDFSTLYTTLPHNLIKDNLLILLKEPSREKALLTLHVMTEIHFLLQKTLKISCMVVSKCV